MSVEYLDPRIRQAAAAQDLAKRMAVGDAQASARWEHRPDIRQAFGNNREAYLHATRAVRGLIVAPAAPPTVVGLPRVMA